MVRAIKTVKVMERNGKREKNLGVVRESLSCKKILGGVVGNPTMSKKHKIWSNNL